MSKIIETIEGLQDLLSLVPATDADIEKVERELALCLADDYKVYIKNYGAILADGVELTGVARSANRDVVAATKREWLANDKIDHHKYVIENVGVEGVIIWQDESGTVYESRPGKDASPIASDLADYLKTFSPAAQSL